MKKIGLLFLLLSIHILTNAQHSFTVLVKDAHEKNPLAGATVSIPSLNKIMIADSSGIVQFRDLPAGKHRVVISFVGMLEQEKQITVPVASNEPVQIFLEENMDEDEEVIIQSTRSTRTIRDIPTRVEFIAGEELDEKANMKPGDIRMVLNESTGIQTQQTSATSSNASIRIQGLDGRYTQVLKDGFPLYGGFSNGLGLLQTPPLDLQQFEVIKGSASTLYGGGAIAGLVDLISKKPAEDLELKLHLDGTSAGGINTSLYAGKKFKKIGATYFFSRNSNAAYDPSDIGLTAIPKFERYTVNPKLFIYFNDRTTLNFGINFTHEDRKGGDIDFIKNKKPSGFFENNRTDRYSTQLTFEHQVGKQSQLTIKNSLGRFDRIITTPGYRFNGRQYASFTEVAFANHGEQLEWITGVNLVTDKFQEPDGNVIPRRDYNQWTIGAFIQNNWKTNDWFNLETGLRADRIGDYGWAVLPRIAAVLKFNSKLTSRIGGGLGYKTPTIFTEETERILYRYLLPIDPDLNKLERSYGVNADLNFKTRFAGDRLQFSINHLFFYTRITDPLLLVPGSFSSRLVNVEGHIDTRGMETNMKWGYENFKLFIGYTLTQTYLHQGTSKTKQFLTPKHRVNSVLLYEIPEKLKLGLEAYYFSEQQLSDGLTGRSYWITGFMAEKLWEKFSVYINFENFLDSRQTRFDTIYTGTISNPAFRDIYAPLDGFVVNGGVKVKL